MTQTKDLPNVTQRLMSLDAFRGFTIIAMLMVNNPGYDSAFPDQFRHALWGSMVTFCDMIFPWFLLMVGVALPFSASSFKKRNPSLAAYYSKLLRRSLLLFVFGVLISCGIAKKIAFGLGGVLQLIALANLAGALIYELPRKIRYSLAAFLLIGYWILIRFVPIPGIGAGFFEEEKNIIAYINNTYLGQYHMAGLLSVIPTAALVIIGTYLGEMFRNQSKSAIQKLGQLITCGIVFIVLGLFWHLDLIMTKHVWTPSYILFSAGTGSLMLALFYWLIDIRKNTALAFPFMVYGMNAITAYFISIMVRVHTVQEWMTTNAAGEKITVWQAMLDFWVNYLGVNFGSYCFTGSYILFWWVVLYWMYRRKLFLKV